MCVTFTKRNTAARKYRQEISAGDKERHNEGRALRDKKNFSWDKHRIRVGADTYHKANIPFSGDFMLYETRSEQI